MPDGSPVIETRGLTKVFSDFWMRPRVTAVEALDLGVRPHEVFGLLGPNGSGKSTTIKMVLGLLFPTRGRVAVFGKLPTDVATKKRIGYLPEESYLYRFLNARETLDYYGRLFGIDRQQRNKRIDMLLEMIGLQAVQRRPVGEYSKGMQRRIGLAQALINDPDLLILDEPTTGLDPIGTRQIKNLILQLRDRGKTVLLSSHLLADVEDVCDRACILYGGKKRVEGTIDELLTVDGTYAIQTDELSEQTLAHIERLIEREEPGKSIRKVDRPRQKLESLFLDIVEQAQKEGAATSGARGGGGVAGFLAGEAHLPEDVDGKALIDELVTGEREPPPSEGPPQGPAAQAPAETRAPARDQAVLEELTQPAPEPAPEREDAEADEPPDAARPSAAQPQPQPRTRTRQDVDRDVLDELTGQDEKG